VQTPAQLPPCSASAVALFSAMGKCADCLGSSCLGLGNHACYKSRRPQEWLQRYHCTPSFRNMDWNGGPLYSPYQVRRRSSSRGFRRLVVRSQLLRLPWPNGLEKGIERCHAYLRGSAFPRKDLLLTAQEKLRGRRLL